MNDKSNQMVLSALSRAVTAAEALPLHGGKNAGLFPTTTGGKEAARHCLDEGYLQPVEPSAAKPCCAITDKGFALLVSQASPREALENFTQALDARKAQLETLHATVRDACANLDALKTNVGRYLQQIAATEKPAGLLALFNKFRSREDAPAQPADAAMLAHLAAWQKSGAPEDCPLPELHRRCCQDVKGLSIGSFHDALRRLRSAERVYLHPWTGPLYDLPEPAFALLVGHEIAFYASVQNS